MVNHEQAVRDAALALKTAIGEAVAAGFRVNLPAQVGDLDKVAISETAKMPPREPLTRPPVSTFKQPLPDAEPA
jgi:hypothetical protein